MCAEHCARLGPGTRSGTRPGPFSQPKQQHQQQLAEDAKDVPGGSPSSSAPAGAEADGPKASPEARPQIPTKPRVPGKPQELASTSAGRPTPAPRKASESIAPAPPTPRPRSSLQQENLVEQAGSSSLVNGRLHEPPVPKPRGTPKPSEGTPAPRKDPHGSRWCRQNQRRSQPHFPQAAALGHQARTAGRWRMEAPRRWPSRAQRPAWSPNPITLLRRRRRRTRRKRLRLHPAWPPALPWATWSPHRSPCTPGTALPLPAARRQRSALPPALPAHPHWLSTPPASRTRSRLQPHHRQRSVWRACHPRAPARLQVGSFWSRQLCPRAPQSLLSMPLAPLETLSASLPTPLWHPLGS